MAFTTLRCDPAACAFTDFAQFNPVAANAAQPDILWHVELLAIIVIHGFTSSVNDAAGIHDCFAHFTGSNWLHTKLVCPVMASSCVAVRRYCCTTISFHTGLSRASVSGGVAGCCLYGVYLHPQQYCRRTKPNSVDGEATFSQQSTGVDIASTEATESLCRINGVTDAHHVVVQAFGDILVVETACFDESFGCICG